MRLLGLSPSARERLIRAINIELGLNPDGKHKPASFSLSTGRTRGFSLSTKARSRTAFDADYRAPWRMFGETDEDYRAKVKRHKHKAWLKNTEPNRAKDDLLASLMKHVFGGSLGDEYQVDKARSVEDLDRAYRMGQLDLGQMLDAKDATDLHKFRLKLLKKLLEPSTNTLEAAAARGHNWAKIALARNAVAVTLRSKEEFPSTYTALNELLANLFNTTSKETASNDIHLADRVQRHIKDLTGLNAAEIVDLNTLVDNLISKAVALLPAKNKPLKASSQSARPMFEQHLHQAQAVISPESLKQMINEKLQYLNLELDRRGKIIAKINKANSRGVLRPDITIPISLKALKESKAKIEQKDKRHPEAIRLQKVIDSIYSLFDLADSFSALVYSSKDPSNKDMLVFKSLQTKLEEASSMVEWGDHVQPDFFFHRDLSHINKPFHALDASALNLAEPPIEAVKAAPIAADNDSKSMTRAELEEALQELRNKSHQLSSQQWLSELSKLKKQGADERVLAEFKTDLTIPQHLILETRKELEPVIALARTVEHPQHRSGINTFMPKILKSGALKPELATWFSLQNSRLRLTETATTTIAAQRNRLNTISVTSPLRAEVDSIFGLISRRVESLAIEPSAKGLKV